MIVLHWHVRRAIAVDSAHVVSIYFNAWLQTPKGFVTRACCKECTCNCLRSASSWSSRVHGLPSYPTLLYLVCPLGVGEHKPPMQELVTAASTRGVICRASARWASVVPPWEAWHLNLKAREECTLGICQCLVLLVSIRGRRTRSTPSNLATVNVT